MQDYHGYVHNSTVSYVVSYFSWEEGEGSYNSTIKLEIRGAVEGLKGGRGSVGHVPRGKFLTIRVDAISWQLSKCLLR